MPELLVFKSMLHLPPRRQWHPTPILLPGKSHGQRSLVGCSPCGCEESDTNEQLHFHFSLSPIGERNGNPFQCSCLENPMDRGAWWTAVYGVAQSQTRLEQLSSSNTYVCRIQKTGTEEFIYRATVEKHTERIDLWTWGEGRRG